MRESKTKTLTLDEIQTAFAPQQENPASNQSDVSFVFMKDTFGFVIAKESLDEMFLIQDGADLQS